MGAWPLRDQLLAGSKGSIYARALSAELRAARAREGISRHDLAELAGVPERTLTRIESGDVAPKAEQVAHLVWTLRLSLATFYAAVEDSAVRLYEHAE